MSNERIKMTYYEDGYYLEYAGKKIAKVIDEWFCRDYFLELDEKLTLEDVKRGVVDVIRNNLYNDGDDIIECVEDYFDEVE